MTFYHILPHFTTWLAVSSCCDGVSPLGELSPEVFLRMASALFSFIDSIGETFEGVVENAAQRRFWWSAIYNGDLMVFNGD